MKKAIAATLFLFFTACAIGCSGSQQNSVQPQKKNNVLIVFYSHSGHTREVARQLQQLTGGDLVELETAQPYPSSYDELTRQAKREQQTGYKPELKTRIDNLYQYDTIYLGTPVWWSGLSLPLMTFLSQHDLSGKTIMPFVTHGGGGEGRCFTNIKDLCQRATVKHGFSIKADNVKNAKTELPAWLRQEGIVK